ncbi:MAG: MauE/DoxX family redox-associated membrane protein [Candidatus Gracilibacteria bacterium]
MISDTNKIKNMKTTSTIRKAAIYRMQMHNHTCPYGLKAKYLLERKGFQIEDHLLTSREEVEAFKATHNVKTTPQVFIGEERIGGYDDLRRYFGKALPTPDTTSYKPVIALFSMTLLMALAASFAAFGTIFTIKTIEWFAAFSMSVLALLKLQNIESFSTMFLNYDLLAKRWIPYSYIYPFAEGLAGVLMIAGIFTWLSASIALFIGTVGAISVFKAAYIDQRELKCACVGGGTNVPLGFISLTENLVMIAMAIWMALSSMDMAQSVGHIM